MNKIRKFEEYIERKIVKRQHSDVIRAKDLVKEAEKDKRFLDEIRKKISLTDENSNNLIDQVYNIARKLIRAKMLIEGYKASGQSAHEAEVSYMIKLGFSEAETEFMNEVRYSRNGILYYGSSFDKEYAGKVLHFLDKNYVKLINNK